MKQESIFLDGPDTETTLRRTYDVISRQDDDFDADEDDLDDEEDFDEEDTDDDLEPDFDKDIPGNDQPAEDVEREPQPGKDREQQEYNNPHPDISKDQPKA